VWTRIRLRQVPLEAVDRAFAAVRGAVVDDHEHALRFAVGLGAHELINERVERCDPVLGRAAVKQLRALGVPACEVAERAFALVLVLDLLSVARGRGERWMLVCSGLDRGFLVCAHDEVAGMRECQRNRVSMAESENHAYENSEQDQSRRPC